MNELKSYTEYAVSTPTADFVIGFDFNYGEDAVNVTVDNVPATEAGYTVVYLNETTIRLSPSVPSGVVRLQRETDIDQTDHAYRAGAKFIAQTMDENFEQLRHAQQEVRDGFSKLSTDTNKIIDGLDAALELAQDAAQDAQDAAVIAQGAADTVNTIIIGGKVGASNVLDASTETQQQVNYNGGSKWHSRVGGYKLNERVVLTNGDIVKNTINGNTNDPNVDMTGWVSIGNAGEVESITDLITIPNPKNGSRVFVKSIQKWYMFNVNLTEPENGVTVIGKWEMEIQEAYYASWFAEPSVTTDQSAGLRVGYAYATSKKRAFIVDDHFYVDSSINSGDPNGNLTALKTLSNSVLAFTPNGKIEHLPTNKSSYNIIHTMNVENYVILDPVLIGERDNHIGTTGEWGYLLTIYQSTNGYIRRPQCFNAWGDGIYIGKAAGTLSNDVPTNIIIEDPIVDRARRNGISFTAGNKVKIIRPIVSNTSGVAPEAGLDIEPEEVGVGAAFPATITNSIVDNPTFLNNKRNIWISWYGNGRHIDVRFTGVTKLVGGNYPLTIYARSYAANDTQSGAVHFECIDYTCTNANNRFETELMFEDRGAIIDVDRMIIRKATKWVTHLVRFGTLDKPLKGFSVKSIDSQTLVDAYFTTTSVAGDKSTLRPVLNLGFSDNIYVMTDPDNASSIVYGAGNIGGYSVRTSASYEYSYHYPANRIVVTPYADAYLRLNNDFRRLKIVIDSVDASIHRTLYIHGVNVALLDGTVRAMVALQGKGAWIDIQKNSSGRDTLFNLFGNAN